MTTVVGHLVREWWLGMCTWQAVAMLWGTVVLVRLGQLAQDGGTEHADRRRHQRAWHRMRPLTSVSATSDIDLGGRRRNA